MAEHDGNGDGGITPEDKIEQATTLERLEEQRLAAARKRLETNRDDALEQGEILKALRSTIELEKQQLKFAQEFYDTKQRTTDQIQKELEILEAQENILNKSAAVAKRLFKESEAANFAEDIARASQATEGLFKGLEGLGVGLNKANFNTRALGRSMVALAERGLRQVFKQTVDLVNVLDQQRAAFTAQTGLVGDLRDQIGALSMANLSLGVSFEDVAGATTALASGFSQFIALSPAVQESLTTDAALLQKVGLNTATSAATINELNRSLGQTPQEAMRTTKSLAALGIELGIGADQINQNFVQSLPTLRVYGDRAVEVFRRLQVQAREAGVSVASLTSTFGEQLNTFEGSARAAGRLNAVLGTDLFSSTELLLATESERIDIMRDRLAMSGVEFANLGKFQQLALANAAGISDVNEAAKIFGTTQGEVTTQIGGLSLTQAELEERIQAGRSVVDKFKFALMSLAVAVEPLADMFASFGNFLIGFTERMGNMPGIIKVVSLAMVGLAGFKAILIATKAALDGVAASGARAAAGISAANAAASAGPPAAGGAAGAGALGGAARTVGKAGRLARMVTPAGLIATLGGAALSTSENEGARRAGSALSMGATGAMIGSVFGPAGMAAFGTLGALGGALMPMAEGGIVTGPTPALVGEAGAEAIVPLDMFTNKLDELINAVKSPTGGSDIVVKVMLNERELGEAVVPIVDKRVLGR